MRKKNNDKTFSIFPNENFVDLGPIQFGREQCKPAKSFGPATRNHFLFHYILAGEGTLIAEDRTGIEQTYQVKANQGFLLFPGQVSMYIADYNAPWEYAWVEFDGLRVQNMLASVGLTTDSPIYQATSTELRENMKQELLYITEHEDASNFHLIGHLYLFLDYLIRSATLSKADGDDSNKIREFYVHEAINFIQQNFQRDITIEQIAHVCGLNRSYFGKIFRSQLGKSPQEFLISFRMTKAAELLKQSSLSVSEIGSSVGYEDAMHFSRAFKSIYGISPQQWRKKNQEK